ncbi:MAG: hypothetical protein DDT21_00024 [Syntrophomonadaceae bacterium]|nr:hypothetical protein [Bacillota bacterium]
MQDDTLSAALQSVLSVRTGCHITVDELMSRIAERGFGMLLVLLALPTLVPVLPPGSAATIGLIYTFIGFQMLLGRKYPWLPQRIRDFRLSENAARKLRERGVSFFKNLERFSRARWLFMETALMLRLVALTIILMGFILFTPLPFMNTIPALAVMILGTGLLNRDGLFLLIGLVLSFSLLGFIYFGLAALLQGLWQ